MLGFITIEFLKDKLKELKSSKASDELLVYQLEKEIALLNRINIKEINMRGTPEDFERNIDNNELIFLPIGEWDRILKERVIYKKCKQLFVE